MYVFVCKDMYGLILSAWELENQKLVGRLMRVSDEATENVCGGSERYKEEEEEDNDEHCVVALFYLVS